MLSVQSAAVQEMRSFFVCKNGEKRMKNRLQLLCGKFYIPQLIAESGQKVETCRRLLAGRLDKSDRKLVLWITVTQSLVTKKRSVGRSICGLRLAQEMRTN